MGIEFVLGQFEIMEIIAEKIAIVEQYVKADEDYLKELEANEGSEKLIISVTRRDIRDGKRRIKSLKLYTSKVGMGTHRFTLDEIKALEEL